MKKIIVIFLITIPLCAAANTPADDQLFDAIDHANALAVKQALQQGASMTAQNKNNLTPFQQAVMKASMTQNNKAEKEAVVLALVDALPANDVADFVLAAGAGLLNVVKKMRPSIVDINAKEPMFGDNALTAAEQGYDDTARVAEYLVAEKADVNAVGRKRNRTPLHTTLMPDRKNGVAIATILLDHNVRVADSDLVIAAQGSSLPLVKRILEKTGNINATDDIGDTALSMAVERGDDKDIIMFLIAHNANVNAVNPNDPDSILIKALRNYYFQSLFGAEGIDLAVIEALLQHGAIINNRVEAFAQGDFDKVDKLTDQKKFDWYHASHVLSKPDHLKVNAVLSLFEKYSKNKAS